MTDDRDPLEGVDPEVLAWHWGALADDPAVCCAPQPGQDGYPCILNRAYHPEHRDVLGRTWAFHDEALYVAPERLTAGLDGTVTVPTSDHGPVTLTCPVWCAGHEAAPKYRADLGHESVEHLLEVQVEGEPVTLMTAVFERRPFATRPPGTGIVLNLEIDGQFYPLDQAGVDEVAAAMETVTVDLRVLSRRLARYTAENGGGA
ncbi:MULTISPECIES: DUF6907 domain-containing protein [unclassified Streptomyces]|uniref:DUF6907 domain-containing protein n=1 Tax=unclassified Streptomyces TaxID=2593676 RepID=UPI0038109B0A